MSHDIVDRDLTDRRELQLALTPRGKCLMNDAARRRRAGLERATGRNLEQLVDIVNMLDQDESGGTSRAGDGSVPGRMPSSQRTQPVVDVL
jgi:hypothetical protein